MHVVTFCVMSNHFHILLEVPQPPVVKPCAEEILIKLRKLTGCQDPSLAVQELKAIRDRQDPAAEQLWLERFYARMWDVSAFMKLLKQRFTQWYNGRNNREGTLWTSRFKSVVVEGSGETLMTMAAYIELNPVRAGMVADPKDYRWSGYGEAVAGRALARRALQKLVSKMQAHEESWSEALATYRMHVFNQGHEENETLLETGGSRRRALPHEAVLGVLNARGQLPVSDYVRCRVRYFCDGAAIGSRMVVERLFAAHRARFGPSRTSGARRLRGLDIELYALRDLRVNVFG